MLNLKKRNQGFTIVETLIVLAIAGLIILIVLLAVPALQRSSRNTNIKSDAEAIAGAISEYEGNNGGGAPALANGAGPAYTIGAAGTTQATAKIQGATTVTVLSAAPTYANAQTAGTISVWPAHQCNGNPSPRATAIWFPVETSAGVSTFGQNNNNCIDS
jgi:prepilin-type N-terminal cleavage/methylation domain-containing protein